MVKNILVPLAFSEYAQGILNCAADLTLAMDAELSIVNVINERDLEAVDKISSFGYNVDVDHYIDTVKSERRKKIEEMTGKLTLADDKVSFSFLVGEPTHELLNFVVDNEIDMVVMGVKSNDIRHIFTGSVAERMFRKCPVTIVSYRGDNLSQRLEKRIMKHR